MPLIYAIISNNYDVNMYLPQISLYDFEIINVKKNSALNTNLLFSNETVPIYSVSNFLNTKIEERKKSYN